MYLSAFFQLLSRHPIWRNIIVSLNCFGPDIGLEIREVRKMISIKVVQHYAGWLLVALAHPIRRTPARSGVVANPNENQVAGRRFDHIALTVFHIEYVNTHRIELGEVHYSYSTPFYDTLSTS